MLAVDQGHCLRSFGGIVPGCGLRCVEQCIRHTGRGRYHHDPGRRLRQGDLGRFANPSLPDTVERVGRQPLRKLSRHERFIGPAAEIAERGTRPAALLEAIAAALRFDVADDEQSVELQRMLATDSAETIVADVCGLEVTHPLYADLLEVVRGAV